MSELSEIGKMSELRESGKLREPGEALVPFQRVRQAVLDAVQPLAPERVLLAAALGLVAAEDVRAVEQVPPFANSAMDGYAFAAVEASPPLELRVVRRILAGDPPGPPIGPGEAVRIMTGAPLPEGTDAVCMQEQAEAHGADDGGAVVVLHHSPVAGEHVRRAGEDVRVGDLLVAAGTRLSPRHLAALASAGTNELSAYRRPLVGVLSTGSELRSAPEPLSPGQIRDSNRHLLLGLCRQVGADALDLGLVADDEELAAAAIEAAAERCDLVVTSGGVSVGDRDVVKAVLERCCPGRAVETEVAIKPAKPFAFGVLPSGALLIGLPGNPVSAAVSFELFVRPAIACLMGLPSPVPAPLPATAGEPFRRPRDGKVHLVHVRLTAEPEPELGRGGRLIAWRAGGAASHLLASTVEAHGLALVPDGPGLEEGQELSVLSLTGVELASVGPASVGPASVGRAAGEQIEGVR